VCLGSREYLNYSGIRTGNANVKLTIWIPHLQLLTWYTYERNRSRSDTEHSLRLQNVGSNRKRRLRGNNITWYGKSVVLTFAVHKILKCVLCSSSYSLSINCVLIVND
jgi:hypothetical protein